MDVPLKLLMDGLWAEERDRDIAIKEVQGQLAELKVDTALLDAVPIAFANPPSKRGVFDGVAISSVQKAFQDRLENLEKQLEPVDQAAAEAAALAASALLS